MKLKTFFKQCHKKEVFKMLTIYVVSSWLILQVLAVISEPLSLPSKSVTYAIITLLVVFPVYVFYIWKIKVVPTYIVPEETDEDVDQKKKKEFKRMYFSVLSVITVMCFISVSLIVNTNFRQASSVTKVNQSDKIAVLKFGNNTGNPDFDIVSKMASDWIMHGITQNNAGQVISQDVLNEYNAALNVDSSTEDVNALVRKYLNPSKIISGNFYLKNGKLLFQSILKDGKNDTSLIAFEADECSTDDALACIDDLKESIVGFLVTEGRSKEMLQETPPKYDAYKYLLEAKTSATNDEYLTLLNKAIAADPSYFEPKVLRVAQYYNMGRYVQADSLLRAIQPDSHNNKRQLNILSTYSALLKGNNKNVYNSILKEYTIAPFDLKSNKSAMVITMQFVNRPKDVASIFNEIKMDSIDLRNCKDCVDRVYINSLADIELKKYNDVISMLEPITSPTENTFLLKPYLIACIRAGLNSKITTMLSKIGLMSSSEMLADINLLCGKEYLLLGKDEAANDYFKKAVVAASEASDEKIKADALFYQQDFSEAKNIYQKLLADNPKDAETLTQLAICQFKIGMKNHEEGYLENIESLRGPYSYGQIDYALACYFVVKNDEEKLIQHLMKSVADGNIYTPSTFQNDPRFVNYKNSEAFIRILNFWH
ncbi:tetratricopeptide repeat protein [Ulvibacter antarcticus]|uniref:Tetratricopeptide repeat protein n=1 Tax=Ulvibacter antarcticus TaxID=442714 RepID=A0A3L9YU52_9FLAO|nr:tetratricopeptide repeat protein [Ulvibacter antarcticus]RMA64281.1 tetratricopeptide repeat protein [Ulvibacter antarcticus]